MIHTSDGYAWIDGPITYIDSDDATATSWPASWGSGIDMHGGGFVDMRGATLSGFVTGVSCRGGMVSTDLVSRLLDGRNRINAVSNVLIAHKEGWIDFGDTLGGYGTNNCFSLQDLVDGFHVWGGGNGVNAVDSYWGSQQLNFTDVTSFTFKLGEDRHVRLAVYDAMGREVAVVTDADYPRGVHSAVLRSSGLPSGLYFYRLTTEAGVIQRKMLLMR